MLMLRSAMRWVQGMMAKAFYTWKSISADMRRQKQTLRCAMGKFIYQQQARAFAQWLQFVRDQKAARLNARKAFLRWSNRGLARGFLAWRGWLLQRNAAEANSKRSLLRWKKTELSRAFQAWYADTVGRPNFAGAHERAARYMLSAGLGRYFANWRRIKNMMNKRDARRMREEADFAKQTMSLMEQLQAALRKIAELEDSTRNQQPENNLDAELDAAERARKRAEMELEASRKRLQDLLNQGNASASDLDRARREVQGLEDELARANTLIEKLRARIRELEEELRRLRAELAQSKQNANDEWLSEQARRKASDDADARRRKLEDAEARRREEEARRRAEEEEAARRKLLLQKQGDDENLDKIRKMMSHWLNQNMSLAMNKWRDEARHLRRIEMLLKRVALRWKKDKAYKLLVKLRDYAEAKRIKDLEFQAYLTKTKTPTSRARASSRSTYVSPFNSPKHTKSSV
jgi:hypothetical protein